MYIVLYVKNQKNVWRQFEANEIEKLKHFLRQRLKDGYTDNDSIKIIGPDETARCYTVSDIFNNKKWNTLTAVYCTNECPYNQDGLCTTAISVSGNTTDCDC